MTEPSFADRAVFPIRAVIYLRPLKFLDFLAWTLDEVATVILPGNAPSGDPSWRSSVDGEDPEWEIVLSLAMRHGTLWPTTLPDQPTVMSQEAADAHYFAC